MRTPALRLLFALAASALGLPAAAQTAASATAFAPLEAAPSNGGPYRLGREADLAKFPGWMDLEAATAKRAPMTRGSFIGAAGARIHYRLYRHRTETRGGIVIVAGRTEGLVTYQELIHDLVANGYSVYIADHRGQGFSQRLVTSDTTLGYVDDFAYYADDLAAFVAGPVREARAGNAKPLFLLAHSMGGAVAALYLEAVSDSGIAAAALVTPMMEPWAAGAGNPGMAQKLADAYCDRYSIDSARTSPLADKYVDGGPFDAQYAAVQAATPGMPNDLTHSAVRFARHWQARNDARCDGGDCGSPHAKVGGVSVRWFNQSCVATEKARGKAAARITVPALLLQGEKDTVVKPGAQQEFCRNLNDGGGTGYCIGRTVPQALHSIFIEADAYRVPSLQRVLGFFDCVRAGRARCE